MWRLKAYWRVMAISAREEGANPKRTISAIGQLLVRLALIVAIYQAAYVANPKPGLSLVNAVWSIGVYLTFVLALGIRNLSRMIDLEIKSGNVETHLIKPLDWRMVTLCRLLGKSGLEFLVQLVLIPAMLIMIVGLPDASFITPAMIPAFALLFLLCAATVAAMFTMVGLSGFWLNDSTSVYRIVDKLMAAFAGAFVPIALMPTVIQPFIRYSPFGVYASPQNIFNPQVGSLLVPSLIAAAFWATALWIVCEFMWRRAQRRIEVNGG